MGNKKKRHYQRRCKYCGNLFKTTHKYAQVCPVCKQRNYREKKLKKLFNGNKEYKQFL